MPRDVWYGQPESRQGPVINPLPGKTFETGAGLSKVAAEMAVPALTMYDQERVAARVPKIHSLRKSHL